MKPIQRIRCVGIENRGDIKGRKMPIDLAYITNIVRNIVVVMSVTVLQRKPLHAVQADLRPLTPSSFQHYPTSPDKNLAYEAS